MKTSAFKLKTLLIGVIFLVFAENSSAQNFSEVIGTPFAGVIYSSMAFADIDGDNDQDVLITGLNLDSGAPGNRIAKLYTNDGAGNFTEVMNTPFDGVQEGSIAFADVDGDNDQDVLITGWSDSGYISKLYINDGSGNFTEAMGTPFDQVNQSSIALADVDDDNDLDLLITGENSLYVPIAKLYTNDGSGNFTEVINTPFHGVQEGSIAFADVDGDNDQDVLITGWSDSGYISKLYTNDGTGNFTEMTGTPFVGIAASSVAFADIDGDNDQDILMTGTTLDDRITKLYTNDGSGNFTEVMGTPFVGVAFSSIAFADVDNDSDLDLLITGTSLFNMYSTLYINDGSGNFMETADTPLDPVNNGSIAFVDVDGDNYQDLLITGQNLSLNLISKLYTNDGAISSADDLLTNASVNITAFPNPTMSDHLHVRFHSTESSRINVRVYDLNGRLVLQQQAFVGTGKQTLVVDIATLPQGSYFVQLYDNRKAGVARFFVQ
jgi:hypothetical protein